VATLVLVQLAIATLAFGVLAIAAAPALTRPARTLSRPGLDPPTGTRAMVREAARQVAERAQEQGAAAIMAAARASEAARRAGARAAAHGAHAGAASVAATRCAGVRSGEAIRRLRTLALAATSEWARIARERVRSVRDAPRSARGEHAKQTLRGRVSQQLRHAHHIIDLRDRRPVSEPAGEPAGEPVGEPAGPRHRA
jgi:hypothetical protein